MAEFDSLQTDQAANDALIELESIREELVPFEGGRSVSFVGADHC